MADSQAREEETTSVKGLDVQDLDKKLGTTDKEAESLKCYVGRGGKTWIWPGSMSQEPNQK